MVIELGWGSHLIGFIGKIQMAISAVVKALDVAAAGWIKFRAAPEAA